MRPILAIATLAILAACTTIDPPATPPAAPTPPPVATSGFVKAKATATVPLSVPETRAFLTANPIIDFLEPTGDISNPVATEILSGTWAEPGAVRRVRLADGHYLIERVVENWPEAFRYQLFFFTNATGRGVEQIVGEQRFLTQPDGTTRIEWDYDVKPANALTRFFVRRRIAEIETYITGALDRFAAAAAAATTG